MNQVDIYIGDYRLDLFQDEQISISLNAQNIKDISKVFTDFTQSFTVPASGINNEVLKQYYRTDVDTSRITTSSTTNYPIWNNWIGAWETQLQSWGGGSSSTSVENTFDFRFRVPATIEINSIPFRTGVIEMENVLLKGTEPYSYSLTFYGDLVNLTDLFGEDYLYDLDLSAYDHDYNGETIKSGFNQDALEGGNVFYPLMSPVRNWVYNVGAADPQHDDDIHFAESHDHGIHYYELKPAVKVTKILEAIEDKYGIVLTGSFLTSSPFTGLYLWAHRHEGYMYEGQPTAMAYQKVNFNHTAAPTPDYFNLSTDTFTPEGVTGSGDIYDIYFDVDIPSYTDNYYLAVLTNGVVVAEQLLNGPQTGTFFDIPITNYFDSVTLGIKPTTNTPMVYQLQQCIFTRDTGSQVQANVDQTLTATYQGTKVQVSSLMPEIKVGDFLGGIIKMHNLVIIPTNSTTFSLQPLNDWYADGTDIDITQYVDIEEVSVDRPQLYREISFEYQDTEQILGYQYQRANLTGYGDLRANFNFDGGELKIELPFEQPLFERLTDYGGHTTSVGLTNVLVYKSQTREFDTDYPNRLQAYVGAPVLIYGEFSLDVTANPIAFIDESDEKFQIDEVWYANVSSTSTGISLAYSTNWGADIDPYYLASVGKSLYQTYWYDYINDLYNDKRRVYNVSAILPLGEIINLQLNDKLIWNNQKWIINSANVNMTTGETKFQLLNQV